MNKLLALGGLAIASMVLLFTTLTCTYMSAAGHVNAAILLTLTTGVVYWGLTGRFGNAIVVILFCGFGTWAGSL